MPSFRYRSSSALKSWSLKRCCSHSLAWLMHSCSKPLRSRLSKPKMSRMPITRCGAACSGEVGCRVGVASLAALDWLRLRRLAFTLRAMKWNRREYMSLAAASRAKMPSVGVSGTMKVSPRVVTWTHHKQDTGE